MLINIEAIEAFAEQLREAVQSHDWAAAAGLAAKLSSRRAAREMAGATPESIAAILKATDPVKAGRIAGHLPPEKFAAVIEAVPSRQRMALLSRIPPDHAGNILRTLSPENRQKLFAKAGRAKREEWEAMITYAPDTVGAAMTTEFLAVSPDATVAQALEAIASAPPEVEKSTYVYVVSNEGVPLGVASVRDLIRSPRYNTTAKVMKTDLLVVNTSDLAVDAAKRLRNRRYAMLPVIDEKHKLSGVLTLDDAADILAAEVADQFSGITGDVGDESFFTRPRGAIRRRLPWMAGNVFLNLFAVAIISGFEDTIAQVAILAAFLPMITDMGGNVGIQSLSVAIRSIALGEAQIRDYKKAVRKEFITGICNGAVLGALFGLIALAMRGKWLLGLIAGTALGVNVVVAGIVGGCLPFLIKRLGKDPAMMTGPLLTTITDVTGVTIYLGLSTLFLAGLTR